MFVRITFDSGQRVNVNQLKEISEVLGDDVTHTELVKDEEGKVTEFHTYYNHCFDPEEVRVSQETEKKKKLVFKTDMVELSTSKEYLGTLEVFMAKFPSLKIKIRGMVQTSEDTTMTMINRMTEVQTKLEKALLSFDEKIEFNQKCDVHISNLGLLSINQLGFATDMCTEQLQEILKQGWRILAICPQPDQRRPDYVLGRTILNEDNEVQCVKF
jgi:ribulose bisphosphate carboxylase small subunit